ncbi:RNA polymerase II C-terminal domain phosphatase-like 2 isoform X3 [Rutidosis leptorrhynchoides]|uniref:RNA polymerase II C-terminal domain phosphatase-like 2 isoform X3 n=1 Tax=Rutidosis leptorrhynchoides TaxID=125765 RepID=UPI003A995D62
MSRLGFNKCVVYHGEACLGELDVIPVGDKKLEFPNNEIRIHHFSQISERSTPLSVLLTIGPFSSSSTRNTSDSVSCKLESLSTTIRQPLLIDLHATCFYELKTAVVLMGDEEVHLVAMPSKLKKFPCFWCCVVPAGLYNSCLGMLNMRCLSIVFDLDETLIVANTMKSFENRIDLLTSWIGSEIDQVRASGMTSELKRILEDRTLLKQYTDNDIVIDNGQTYQVKLEEVLVNAAGNDRFLRPVIRLPDKNIVLTRINPENRDTSVLVRLRPAWDDLRSYLIAKGRKRFEVFVCTMAEREYALEMWRLLDPGAHLISQKQLLKRVVCVNSGGRKSLVNVFLDGSCHPRMAMVIDDRSEVWEVEDQRRVHMVPPFAPYHAPQAETSSAVPVLCVARNVACNVRGGFFKDFDEDLLRRLSEHFYEDDASKLPNVPDVASFLVAEEATPVPNGNANVPTAEGSEAAHKDVKRNVDLNFERSQQPSSVPTATIHGPPSLRSVVPCPLEKPSIPGPVQGPEISNKQRPAGYNPPSHVTAGSISSAGFQPPISEPRSEEVSQGYRLQKKTWPQAGQLPDLQHHQSYSNNKKGPADTGNSNLPQSVPLSIGVLQQIGQRCGSKVEYKPISNSGREWQFIYEVLFMGEKLGYGVGKSRKDAQQQAAENALRTLAAEKYEAYALRSEKVDVDHDNKPTTGMENGFLWDSDSDESLDKDAENSHEVSRFRSESTIQGRLPVESSTSKKRLNEASFQKSLDSSS